MIARRMSGSLLTAALLLCGAGLYAQGEPAPAPVPPVRSFDNDHTIGMFIDTFRATHIMRAEIVGVVGQNVVLKPVEYLKGDAVGTETISVITGTNADLNPYRGQTITAAVIRTLDGEYGLAHGVHSMTPEHLSPAVSCKFYKDILAINDRYAGQIAEARAINPADGRYSYPAELKREWIDTLIRYFGHTGTQAAHHCSMELLCSPVFKDDLTAADLGKIANHVSLSLPGTYDRGYGFILLRLKGRTDISIDGTIGMLRAETSNVLADHMANYLRQFDEKKVVEALSAVYSDRTGENRLARLNAIIAAGTHGSKLSLPNLRALLGHETDRDIKHYLLDTFRQIPDESNLMPLVNYLNGGDASHAKGVNTDCRDSRALTKRTLLALAMIDSDKSNTLMRQAYVLAKDQWMKDFLKALVPENKEWRGMVMVAFNEDDVPANATVPGAGNSADVGPAGGVSRAGGAVGPAVPAGGE